jgi:uncharacterized OB-fold protein
MSIESFYEYPAGVALSKFLEGLRQGKLMAGRCSRCDRSQIPPRSHCIKCLKPVEDFHEIRQTGVIETFSRSHISLEGGLAQPVTWIYVKFEGVEGGLLHRLDPSVTPEKALKVRPVFHEIRIGSILDIKWFTAVE